MSCAFALLSDTVGPEDLEYSPEDSGNWMLMILDGLNVSPLTSCPSERVLSHPRNFQRWPICLHPADFGSLHRKWSKPFLSTSINIPSGSLKSPRIHPGWGRRRSTKASETEPERRFSFNMEGSEKQTWIFWELGKLSSCQHVEAVFSSQTPEVPKTHQALSVRGKQRNQKYENCVLMCWTSKSPAD